VTRRSEDPLDAAALAIFIATPDLGWDGLVDRDQARRPRGRNKLAATLGQQVRDALVYLAGWRGDEGSAVSLAAMATGFTGRTVSPGGLLIAYEIACGVAASDRIVRFHVDSRFPPHPKYRGPNCEPQIDD
jgi:hypothetical protein